MSFQLPRVVNQQGMKLKPVDLSMSGAGRGTTEALKKQRKLPPSYQKVGQVHASNLKLQKAYIAEDEQRHRRKQDKQQVSLDDLKTVEPPIEKHRLSLSLKSASLASSTRLADDTSGFSRSQLQLAPLDSTINSTSNLTQDQTGNVLLDDKSGGIKSARKGITTDTPVQTGRPNMTTFASPFQPVKIFGDESSSVHSLRAKLSIDILAAGCIDAFCEFFTLSHRAPVMIDPIAETYFSVPQDKLVIIKDLLVRAEELMRNSDFREIYNIYKQIADYFESEKDIQTALYYHTLGQKLAKRSADTLLEGVAHENIGKVYERLGQTENALKSHEAHLSLADASKDPVEMEKARKQLWNVYVKIAKDNEGQQNYNDACIFYEKALKTAKATNDKQLIAKSSFYLGRIYEKLDDFMASMEHQEQYTQLCEQLSDVKGKASAQKALGQLYERLGKLAGALHTYKKFLDSAEECADIKLIAQASERVGLVLNQMGDYEESVPFFERNFDLAQQAGDDEWIREAKVKLGFAKGNANMMKHLQDLVKQDDMQDAVVQVPSSNNRFSNL